jgi:hypothetical protein
MQSVSCIEIEFKEKYTDQARLEQFEISKAVSIPTSDLMRMMKKTKKRMAKMMMTMM